MSRIATTPRPMKQVSADSRTAPPPPTFRLYYFNIRARGELIRMIFHAVGVQFDDVRVENARWLQMKTDMPYRTLPVLEFNGLQLGQTLSIARFLALEFGLRGQSVYEQALTDSVVETADDLLSDFLETVFTEKNSKKADLRRNFVEHLLPTKLEQLDRFQRAYSREYGYIVGDGMTYADLAVYSVLEQIATAGLVEADYYQRFRYPTELRKRVLTHGGLMRYLNSRPRTTV